MRWSMLPVSVAAHIVVFLACLIIPVGADPDMPDPWPSASMRNYVTAVPAPAPVPMQRPRTPALRSTAAPTTAPPSIQPEVELPSTALVADGGLPDAIGTSTGVPTGFGIADPPLPPPPPPPPPPPQRPSFVRPGGVIREPKKVVHVPAIYPEIARAARVEGDVVIEAMIDEHGTVTQARVLKSVALLDAAALSALKQWRYTPTLLNGVPVRVLMTVTFHFSLSDRTP